MNKQEFLEELESGLADVSPSEKASALRYYTEYFDEMDPKRVEESISTLGSPGKIALEIRITSSEGEAAAWAPPKPARPKTRQNKKEATSNTHEEETVHLELTPDPVPQASTLEATAFMHTPPPQAPQPPIYTSEAENGVPLQEAFLQEDKSKAACSDNPRSGGANIVFVAIVVGLVFLLPVFGGVFVSVITGILSLLLVPVILVVAFGAVTIATLALGITLCTFSFANGLIIIGFSLLFAGLTLLCARLAKWSFRLLPSAIRGISYLVKTIVSKVKGGLAI